jgi:CRP-like cAMP-binding protein
LALEDDIRFLSKVSLFHGFTADQLRLIAFGSERRRLAPGEQLFREGENAAGGFVVTGGQINLVANKNEGEVVLDRCFQGSLIGELALIAPSKRVADAVARVESEVMAIPRALFRRMIDEYPQTAAILQAEITQNVRRLVLRLEKLQGRLNAIGPLQAATRKADDENGNSDPNRAG